MSRAELSPLDLQGACFVDAHGRQVILRGVNLGGDSKVPYPDGGTHHPSDFADHRSVSFVGRPFPLDEADEHFARIAHWGFNCLRMLTTWEAVEHAGPGQYDSAYLDYFQEICRRAGEHGLYVIVDFHQDVWSRMTGGDGAPGWVFDALGLDFTRFHAAGAAHVMQRAYRYDDPTPHQDGYPPMSWASNYRRPANGILWTLFWAGRTITPDFRVDGRNVQDFLQTHLLGAMDQVAQQLKHLPNVIGFDTLNEPGTGWLGQALPPAPLELGQAVPVPALPGLVWSPLQALGVARGLPTQLPVIGQDDDGVMRVQSWQVVNPHGVSIWRQSGGCPFEQAGIYTVHNGQAVPLRSDAFQRCEGREFSLANDAYGPYFHVVADTIRRHNPQWLVFAEIDPFGSLAGRPFPREMPARSVNASHWYDVTLLLGKRFDSAASVDVFTGQVARGSDELRDRHVRQLTRAMQPAQHFAGGAPTLIGEFGIPYDLNSGSAYSAWAEGRRDDAVWRDHIEALSLMYDAMDRLLLSSTQWNYCSSNRNDPRIGDGWNQEDLSIYSADQTDGAAGLDSGGRAVAGFCRPYVRAVQGRLQTVAFDGQDSTFTITFTADPTVAAPTEIFLPRRTFPSGIQVVPVGPTPRLQHDSKQQRLHFWVDHAGLVQLKVRPRIPGEVDAGGEARAEIAPCRDSSSQR